MNAYNTATKNAARFIISFTSAFDGDQHENHYVTRKAAERNLEQLKLAGHKDIEFKEINH
ncbi:MAG: hypothetical protein HUK20_06025 [Fibrobacter sp.]|nr:hypothetical protein [Fibrobacter sp.]